MGIQTRLPLPLLPILLLALLLLVEETDASLQDPNGVLTSLLPSKELTEEEVAILRWTVFALGANFLQTAAVIYIARKKYRFIASKYGDEYYDEDDYDDEGGDEDYDYDDEGGDEDYDQDYQVGFPGGVMDYRPFRRPSHMTRQSVPPSPPPPPPPPGLQPPFIYIPGSSLRGPSPQRPSPTPHKRSLQAPPPPPLVAKDLQEAVKKLHEAKEISEAMMKTANLIQEVMKSLDEDSCLLKLLCHLQEKPQDTRAPEEDLLVRLYLLNAPAGGLTCRQGFFKCPVEKTQLLEVFLYTWQVQNIV